LDGIHRRVAILDLNLKLKKYRIKPEEYDLICKLLNRPPEGVEWALFSSLWSEHCSYKSSKNYLKAFRSEDPRILTDEGENAGVFDLGLDERMAFKMESHNHPSFIEPFHGAATGVGGILRDIFTMGARPIALANFLCFGDSESPRMKSILRGVAKGISTYGNCVGVPTVTGATHSESEYNSNVLVNAFALGLFEKGQKMISAKACGIGNLVVYVGAKTGSDGVHGASMASESFDSQIEAKKPTIQIGDAYFEKLLIEACLEVLEKDLVVAMQDMGAAGLTSSSFEMASRGGVGFNLNLSEVPLRDSRMGPEEILLSESQERMLLICEPSKKAQLEGIYQRWGLEFKVIGEVVQDRRIQLKWQNEVICEIDPDLIVEHAPRYQRPYHQLQVQDLNLLKNHLVQCEKDWMDPKWIYRQFDQRVGLRTEVGTGNPVASLRLKSNRNLGIAVGARPWLLKMDPKLGAYDAAIEPCLKLMAQGFYPQAMTDCLNFGNPEKVEVMSQFVAAVEAISDVAKIWKAPVISGNVSFYNETENRNIIPTPAVAVVGLKSSSDLKIGSCLSEEGMTVGVLYLQKLSDPFDAKKIFESASLFFKELPQGQVRSARLVTEKGLEYCLFKMSESGFGISMSKNQTQLQACLYQYVVEAGPDFWKNLKIPFEIIGTTKKTNQSVNSKTANRFNQTWGLI
jgi:phosphoribosylformylglycinamidine synthase II